MIHTGSAEYVSFSGGDNYRYDINGRPQWKKLEIEGRLKFSDHFSSIAACEVYDDQLYYLASVDEPTSVLKSLNLPKPDVSYSFYDIASFPDGGPLVLASSQGLMLVNPHWGERVMIQHFGKESGLPTAFVNKVRTTEEGNVWMLLYEHGLAYFDLRTQRIYTWSTREGLISEFLSDLTVMGDEVWVKAHDDRVARYKITDLLKNHAKIQKNTTRNAGS